MAQILKGAPVVAAMNEANAARCAALKEKGIVPTLAVVRVGAREDDISYEKGIVTRCGKVGVEVRQFHLAEDVTQEELLDVIRQINGDASVHGCLIFRPLPKRFDDRRVQEACPGKGRGRHHGRLDGRCVYQHAHRLSALHGAGLP